MDYVGLLDSFFDAELTHNLKSCFAVDVLTFIRRRVSTSQTNAAHIFSRHTRSGEFTQPATLPDAKNLVS